MMFFMHTFSLRIHSLLIIFQIFNARQLALKLIANVTYGYTAAGFSGRMPCAELADSIVQCGRSTLEKAISFVNENEKWKAKVIYGDTDRYTVYLVTSTNYNYLLFYKSCLNYVIFHGN